MRAQKIGALTAAVLAFSLARQGWAQTFGYGNVVVQIVGTQYVSGAGGDGFDFYEFAPVTTVASDLLPAVTSFSYTGTIVSTPKSGADALSVSSTSNRDRHVERSLDGRFLTFVGYNAAPGIKDPNPRRPNGYLDPINFTAVQVPRVVGLLGANGSLDVSTKITDAYNFTSIRGAVTPDGQSIWVAGDNGSGLTTAAGGLHFTTRGASVSANLSRNAASGTGQTSDNVRQVGIFGGQLYDSSGSNSSIGKSTFKVGPGVNDPAGTINPLPTSGPQLLSSILPGAFNSEGYNGGNYSTTDFVLMDLDPNVPGLDTGYFACSTPTAVCKFVRVPGEQYWTPAGQFVPTLLGNADKIDQLAARANDDGSVTLYVAGYNAVTVLTDRSAKTSNWDVTTPLSYDAIVAGTTPIAGVYGTNYSIGGIDFAPSPLRYVRWAGDSSGTWTGGTTIVATGAFVDTLTANQVWFNNRYSATSGDVVSFGTPSAALTGSTTITIAPAGVQPISTTLNIAAGATITFTGGAVLTGPVTKSGPGTARFARILTGDSVTVTGGTLSFTGSGVAQVVSSLSIAKVGAAYQGTIDVGLSDVIVQSSDLATANSKLSSLRDMVKAWYNNGAFNGAGLAALSGTAYTTVAVFPNWLANGSKYFTSYDGQTLGLYDVVVRMAYQGDVNLDGVIDGADYKIVMESAIVGGRTGWQFGDINYDGVINSQDLSLLAVARANQTLGNLGDWTGGDTGGISAIPEPHAPVICLGAAAMTLAHRRRR